MTSPAQTSSSTSSRIPLLDRSEWTNAARDVFAVMDGQEAWENGSRFNIVNILAHHPAVAVPYMQFNRSLLFDTKLSPRLREIAVLRIAHLSRCNYLWVQHVRIGTAIGLTAEDIDAIKNGQPLPRWSELERLVMQVSDELDGSNSIGDALWAALSRHLDKRLLLELLWIVGGYKSSAWIFNAVRVPLEDGNPLRNFAGA